MGDKVVQVLVVLNQYLIIFLIMIEQCDGFDVHWLIVGTSFRLEQCFFITCKASILICCKYG